MIDPITSMLLVQAANLAIRIIQSAEAAAHNRRICASLSQKVRVANASIEGLRARHEQSAEWFGKQTYKAAFELYVNVLEQIKDYVSLVSTKSGIFRLARAQKDRAEFERLSHDLDWAMQALCLGISVSSYEQQMQDRKRYEEDQAELLAALKAPPAAAPMDAILHSARDELLFSSPEEIRQAQVQAEDLEAKHKQFDEKASAVFKSARDELLFSGPDSFGAVADGERLFKERKYTEAWNVFVREAQKTPPSPRALYWLGYFTYFGPRYGEPQDIPSAQTHFEKAATLGDLDAADMLGVCLKTAKNYPEAIRWFHVAADGNHVHGSYHLGMMYLVAERAPGGRADREQAKFYLQRAAQAGHEDAKKQLERNGLEG
ncbi:hypothetical protein HK104_010535 [Borealophlyctis nickersoniae]|nr:hypothetical protein HK104_010535 [Borealophlyctis nickersoniae]